MPGENRTPTYRIQYIGRELRLIVPDPATSGEVQPIILSSRPGGAIRSAPGVVRIYKHATGLLTRVD